MSQVIKWPGTEIKRFELQDDGSFYFYDSIGQKTVASEGYCTKFYQKLQPIDPEATVLTYPPEKVIAEIQGDTGGNGGMLKFGDNTTGISIDMTNNEISIKGGLTIDNGVTLHEVYDTVTNDVLATVNPATGAVTVSADNLIAALNALAGSARYGRRNDR